MLRDLGPPTCGARSEIGSRAVSRRLGFGALMQSSLNLTTSLSRCLKISLRRSDTNGCAGLNLANGVSSTLTSSASMLVTTGMTTLFLLLYTLHPIVKSAQRLTFLLRLRLPSESRNLMSQKRMSDRMVWLSVVDC
ncbi:hypothetical protein IEO21_08655 [Rhodonia placenta]|uniref:Uncharacterized protein n=1 Tax=Rhodonia placenta TaxID=104341 RepID=A0A8H7TZ67_9APHY|nr:hypothetical protein IEO21_08655 [Postia placenta]